MRAIFTRLRRSLGFSSLGILPALRRRASEIKAKQRDTNATNSGGASIAAIPGVLQITEESIQRVVTDTKAALGKLSSQRAAADYFRLLQATYRIYRQPKTSDPFTTIILVMLFWLLEGGMAGAILISEGRMDVPAGLAYGLIFALVNIVLGLLIGYLPLRYLTYRSPVDLLASGASDGRDRAAQSVRRLALLGLCVGLAAEAVLIFSAARLRALGTHDHVFDFSDVGFWATFDDSLAIIIVVIGVCSVVLAILKGYRGLDDPIPGFSDAYNQATADIDAGADEIAELAEEAIEEACEAALERADDALTDARDALAHGTGRMQDLARSVDLFNDDVRNAQDAARVRVRKDRKVAAFVSGVGPLPPTHCEADAYDALILPGIDAIASDFCPDAPAEIAQAEAAITELEAMRDRCLARIRADLAAFRSDSPRLHVLIHEGGHNG